MYRTCRYTGKKPRNLPFDLKEISCAQSLRNRKTKEEDPRKESICRSSLNISSMDKMYLPEEKDWSSVLHLFIFLSEKKDWIGVDSYNMLKLLSMEEKIYPWKSHVSFITWNVSEIQFQSWHAVPGTHIHGRITSMEKNFSLFFFFITISLENI